MAAWESGIGRPEGARTHAGNTPISSGVLRRPWGRISFAAEGGGSAVVFVESGFRPCGRFGLARHPVDAGEEDAARGRHAPVVLRPLAPCGPHIGAQREDLDPDHGPDHGEMHRESGWRVAQRHARIIRPDTEVSDKFIAVAMMPEASGI